MNDQYPVPSSASVRVEFSDGTFREFHVRKPLRVEVDMPHPLRGLPDLSADLGALPVEILPPTLPRFEVRMKAGISAEHQVITMDSRREDPAMVTGRLLSLLGDAVDLFKQRSVTDPLTETRWRDWERKAGMLLRGELQR